MRGIAQSCIAITIVNKLDKHLNTFPAAMSDFTPITAIQDQFGEEFTEAYKWDVDKVRRSPTLRTYLEILIMQIIKFLKYVSEDPSKYKAPTNHKANLNMLYKAIDSVR